MGAADYRMMLQHSRHSCCCSLLAAQRFFGFVESTADNPEELLQGLGPQEYETKTRGEQAAEGWVHGCTRPVGGRGSLV